MSLEETLKLVLHIIGVGVIWWSFDSLVPKPPRKCKKCGIKGKHNFQLKEWWGSDYYECKICGEQS